MGDDQTISLVILARNEAEGIDGFVKRCLPHAHEVIVVDGHSTDGTAALALAAGATRVVSDHGRGKGDAYKVGIREATGDVIVFIDADGSHDPALTRAIAAPIIRGDADFVIGSRHKGGSDEWKGDLDTYLRAVGGGILTLAINSIWKSDLTECLNGFRAIRKSLVYKLNLGADDFDIEQHMIVQCLKKKLRVAEVACHEYQRQWGASKLPTYRKAYLFFWRLFLDIITPW